MINLKKEAKNRIFFVTFLIVLCFFAIAGRLFWLQIIQHDYLQQRASQQQHRTINLAARRGNIYDQKGELLATSIAVQSLYAVPRQIKNKHQIAKDLSTIINQPEEKIFKAINNQRYFVWLARRLESNQVIAIQALKEFGLQFIPEEKRFYLYDNLASHIIGFTNIDDQGLSGIEYAQNKHLKGTPGQYVMSSDLFGKEIYSHTRKIQEPVDGKKMTLAIHSFLQYVAQRELLRAIQISSANAGCVIIANPHNGEILAMASYPDYNPNQYYKYTNNNLRNRAIETIYEPGSTLKAISIAAAINENVVKPDTLIDCPDSFSYGSRVINDSHKHEVEQKTVTTILAESLNVGTAKIGLMLGKNKLYEYLKRFGFGDKTGFPLPGESYGMLRSAKNWDKSDEAIIPFGQSIAVTPIQLVMAISAIANGGILYEPIIIKSLEGDNGRFQQGSPAKEVRRVISEKTAKQIREMMVKVTTEGTAEVAKIYGYNVAGKTGTAQKVNPNGRGYLKDRYIGSFIGFLPAESPKAVILVMIDDPALGRHHGSVCAAPAFKIIAEETIRYLSIAPN